MIGNMFYSFLPEKCKVPGKILTVRFNVIIRMSFFILQIILISVKTTILRIDAR